MQTKRKSEGSWSKSKFLKLEHNTSLTISSENNEKSKVLTKNVSKTSPKNIATRSSARLSRQTKIEKFELIKTDSISEDSSGSRDSVLIDNANLPKPKLSSVSIKDIPSSSKLQISAFPSNKPSHLSTNLHSTAQHKTNTCRSPRTPATSFYTDYCLINENNVDLMLHKSFNATYSMKVILMSLKEELKSLVEPCSCIRDTHLKKRRLLASKLVKAYSGYKHAVLNNLSMPSSTHILNSKILPHNSLPQSLRKEAVITPHRVNSSANVASRHSDMKNSDEVIELSEDSDDAAQTGV